ncbi:MAG: hypothetical protein FWE45_01615 [Firmicutes bacterium]|nr:hypothetical protein [Bacillota bacterium]
MKRTKFNPQAHLDQNLVEQANERQVTTPGFGTRLTKVAAAMILTAKLTACASNVNAFEVIEDYVDNLLTNSLNGTEITPRERMDFISPLAQQSYEWFNHEFLNMNWSSLNDIQKNLVFERVTEAFEYKFTNGFTQNVISEGATTAAERLQSQTNPTTQQTITQEAPVQVSTSSTPAPNEVTKDSVELSEQDDAEFPPAEYFVERALAYARENLFHDAGLNPRQTRNLEDNLSHVTRQIHSWPDERYTLNDIPTHTRLHTVRHIEAIQAFNRDQAPHLHPLNVAMHPLTDLDIDTLTQHILDFTNNELFPLLNMNDAEFNQAFNEFILDFILQVRDGKATHIHQNDPRLMITYQMDTFKELRRQGQITQEPTQQQETQMPSDPINVRVNGRMFVTPQNMNIANSLIEHIINSPYIQDEEYGHIRFQEILDFVTQVYETLGEQTALEVIDQEFSRVNSLTSSVVNEIERVV